MGSKESSQLSNQDSEFRLKLLALKDLQQGPIKDGDISEDWELPLGPDDYDLCR